MSARARICIVERYARVRFYTDVQWKKEGEREERTMTMVTECITRVEAGRWKVGRSVEAGRER